MTRITIGWTLQFASTKSREMGMSSGEIFWVNLFGTLVASGVVNRYVNGLSAFGTMDVEDATRYNKYWDEFTMKLQLQKLVKVQVKFSENG